MDRFGPYNGVILSGRRMSLNLLHHSILESWFGWFVWSMNARPTLARIHCPAIRESELFCSLRFLPRYPFLIMKTCTGDLLIYTKVNFRLELIIGGFKALWKYLGKTRHDENYEVFVLVAPHHRVPTPAERHS